MVLCNRFAVRVKADDPRTYADSGEILFYCMFKFSRSRAIGTNGQGNAA